MTFALLSFARPWWFLALPPLAILVWRLWRAPDDSETLWRRVIDTHLLPHLLVRVAARRRHAGLTVLAGGWFIAVLALAGPTFGQQAERVQRRDVTRVLVLDLSQQMAANDPAPSRIDRIKLKLPDLLRTLSDGQTALIVYAGEPYLVVPPTTDIETIARFIPELAIDAVPVPGNRPEHALRMANKVLARSASETRDLLWITAGADAAEPLPELSGARLSILHAAAVDDPALAAAAQRSGGTYLRLRSDDGDIRQLAAALTARGGWIADARRIARDGADIGYWLVLALLPLAALAFRRGILMLVAPLVLAGLCLPQPADARDVSLAEYPAWRLFESGNPEAAAARFADPRWRAAAQYRAGHYEQAASLWEGQGDADSLYNRGNALAKLGRMADALAAYDASLKLRANDPDTRHNRDLVQRLLNQQNRSGQTDAPNQSGGKGAQGQRPPPASASQNPQWQDAPKPPAGAAQGRSGDAEREAARVAEQWLRGVPDQPGSLLRRKLQIEHQKRLAGDAERSW